MPTVDERDVYIRVVDQRVREGHAHSPRAYDEVVSLQRSHHHSTRLQTQDGSDARQCYEATTVDGRARGITNCGK